MANTYTSLHYHFAFSTKNRHPWITPDIEERIWSYLAGIARTNKMKPLKAGGIDDHDFAWQDGYGAFTVSKSQVPDLIGYIEKQREHHRTRTYQDEYRLLLDRHGIEYDERYIWD